MNSVKRQGRVDEQVVLYYGSYLVAPLIVHFTSSPRREVAECADKETCY
jgi:hypothetical protein